MSKFDPANGTKIIDQRVEQIRAALKPAGTGHEVSSQPYLVKSWLDVDATSLIYGQSNTGKSFFALDLAFHIAAGRPWNGCRVTQSNVIYVAAEGGIGFSRRVHAISQERSELHAAGADFFCHLPLQLDLHGSNDVDAFLTAVHDREVDMVIVDTLAMSFGAGSENDGKDVTQYLTNVARIRQELSCHVMLVHHSGKDVGKGARGHSSLRAAVDTEIELTVDGMLKVAKATKQRDLEGGKLAAFTLNSVTLGLDADGDPVTSCVVVHQDADLAKKSQRKPLRGMMEVAHQALTDALIEYGVVNASNPAYPAGRKTVSLDEWKAHYLRKRAGDAKPDSLAKDFKRQLDDLIKHDYVRKQDDRAWFISKDDEDKPDM